MVEHLSGYQDRDWEIVDYRLYQDHRSGLWFRGPEPAALRPGQYIVCLGAAQTFGCFCERPYPALLEEQWGMPVVNLGYGGAGPRFFTRHPELLAVINDAALVVVQVMSARSEDNSRFASGGLEYLTDRSTGDRVAAAHAYGSLLAEADARLAWLPGPVRKAVRIVKGPPEVRRVLAETRRNWIDSYRELFASITAPTALLWMSRRRPGWHRTDRARWWWQRYDDVNAMFGDYPQLVNRSMVRAIRPLAGDYVDSTTRRGSPQPLVSRFTGAPVRVDFGRDRQDLAEERAENAYYPSPEMHEDTARALAAPVRRALARASAVRTLPKTGGAV
ncbi:DUF6473 family protein [Demequina sp. SO4-13]|uniref:DUF6473 family protein n=1 Tax=Demequina sp. SO4-13 TaxID=3401027 RepID=UPI003AF90EA8